MPLRFVGTVPVMTPTADGPTEIAGICRVLQQDDAKLFVEIDLGYDAKGIADLLEAGDLISFDVVYRERVVYDLDAGPDELPEEDPEEDVDGEPSVLIQFKTEGEN